jgi:predicted metalloendopeptidase
MLGLMLAAAASDGAEAPVSGIETQYFDAGVRLQDDFYRHVNGRWLAITAIPPDKSSYDSFDLVYDRTQEQLRRLIEKVQGAPDAADPDQRKIADLYASFMDEGMAQALGAKPLEAEFARISALVSKTEIPALIAHLNIIGVSAPYTSSVHQDAHDPARYVFDLGQDGLGLPDRDYYLGKETELRKTRAAYPRHIERMLRLTGDVHAATDARDIVGLETALARIQWTKVENRDPVKTYNPVRLAALHELAPGYRWDRYLAESGVAGKTDYLVVSQPGYIAGFDRLLDSTPLSVWKAYFRWHVLSELAPYLGPALVAEDFAFYGRSLLGSEINRARWKRGVDLVDRSIGEALGRLYVAEYFPPQAKARVEQMVNNLLAACGDDIRSLDWMGPQTRQHALRKLARFNTKIGYPARWRDYSALEIRRADLVGNVLRARVFEYDRNLRKLGAPIDRDEWDMTPQTVNAYYDPEKNEIVFPAAILQPPFFNARADDAVNYGAIGAIIGHEISHGFDDEGSQYDGDGQLLDSPGWFDQSDLDQFKLRTRALVDQYAAHAPVPGYPINGELTLGENIADNSGLAIAYQAYRRTLEGREAPVIDGFSGAQRLFIGFAQAWRGKTRDAAAIMWIKSDPHAPDQFRGLLPERNLAAFYDAFGIKSGDRMYLPPDQRVTLW